MHQSVPNYPEWKAPDKDGTMFLWPDAAQVIEDTRNNQQHLSTSHSTLLQNIPLTQVRLHVRQSIGHREQSQPLIAAGHQTELYHSGVWIKNALINAVADRMTGAAIHLAVDTDAPKHLHLHWPNFSMPITDDPNLATAKWSGLLASPTSRRIAELKNAVAHAERHWHFQPMIGTFLETLERLSTESLPLPWTLTDAIHLVEWELGLKHQSMVASPLWEMDGYLLFAHHLIARAGAFAGDYNAALNDYRRWHRMHTSTRPMPDLSMSDGQCEIPFWLDDLGKAVRLRPQVRRGSEGWELSAGEGRFVFQEQADGWRAAEQLRQWLQAHQLRLSPRAITLTMFVRLLLVDQFVHGIGGGKYDQVTDRIISRHLRISSPRFAVATATLYFPDSASQQRVCVSCIREEGHRLRHTLLGGEKMSMVEEIAALPRRSPQRRQAFMAMHAKLKRLAASSPAIAHWEQRLRESEQRQQEQQLLHNRELFFALQPRDRLEQLVLQCDKAFRS